MTKPALTTDEDSACLAELLLKKCCELRDIELRSSLFNANPVDQPHRNPHVDRRRLTVYRRDLTHSRHVIRIVQTMPPDAFNLRGAASQAAVKFEPPACTADAVGTSTLHLQEAIGMGDGRRNLLASSIGQKSPRADAVRAAKRACFRPHSPQADRPGFTLAGPPTGQAGGRSAHLALARARKDRQLPFATPALRKNKKTATGGGPDPVGSA